MGPAHIQYARATDGTRIAYAVYPGEGRLTLNIPPPIAPPMAIVHRVGSLADSLDALFDERRWARFDFRGVGFSDPPGEALSLEDQVADIEAVTNAVGEEMDVFAAYGSCFPALVYAARRPPQWRSLVLVAPGLEGRDYARFPQFDARREIGQTIDELGWYLMLLRGSYDAPGEDAAELARQWRDALPLPSANLHLDALAESDVSSFVPKVELPVLVVTHGMWHGYSSAVAELLPECTFISTEPFYFTGPAGRWLRGVIDEFRAKACESVGTANGSVARGAANVVGLSERERQVLTGIAAGHSNADIATELVMSTRTVERHVQNIYNKLGVHNRVEAANWAREHGGM
jgi:DNA-binding CsgD family transcriptional regulator/pimeloyl-ACP methyl ester carboxylesterase